MNNFARRHMLTVWIALAAFLSGVLAPALSHALPAAHGAQEMQLCTMEGMRTVVLDPSGGAPFESGAPADGPLMKQCPYCALHGGLFPPPAAQTAVPAPAPSSVHPPLFRRAPDPLFAWTAAHPRAPPARD